jgi:hypothetical protein
MKKSIFYLGGALAALLLACASILWAAQGSLNVPTTGPMSPTTFAGTMNTALTAIISKNSGTSAPNNFPTVGIGVSQFQDWMDTSPGSGIYDHRIWDGAVFVNRGSYDSVNHVAMPKVGGGVGTIASGTTVDLGSIRSSYLTVTGSLPGTPITSFGSSALLNPGESKFVEFVVAGQITQNATTMRLPGSVDLNFGPGDTIQAVYLGSGNWRVFDWQKGSGLRKQTGELFSLYTTGTLAGAVRANGNTIGNASSSATERANADTVNLFIFLYVSDANLTVSGGRTAPGNTRAAAITDYNLNKTIVLPDARGRSDHALDDNGASAAGRITSTTATPNGTTLGAVGGLQTLAITQGNLPVVTLTTNITDPGHLHVYTGYANSSQAVNTAGVGVINTPGAGNNTTTNTTGITASTPLGGSGTAYNKMDPFILVSKYLAL